MDPFAGILLSEIVATIFYTFLGLLLLMVCFWIIEKVTHFSLQTELVEQKNNAVAIVLGAALISLALIIGNIIT